MQLRSDTKSEINIIDRHFNVKCPHCTAFASLSPISIPKYELLERYRPKDVGVAYICNACQRTVFLRFSVKYDFGNLQLDIGPNIEEVERPMEDFEHEYLPGIVRSDFQEALSCISNSCFNAFAAMCRRTIQSASAELGADGKDKVQRQVEALRSIADVDDETFDIIKAIVLAGHDGAHPHLPALSQERAEVLLELMKDVMHQLFVRKKKLEEAVLRRQQVIEDKKKND